MADIQYITPDYARTKVNVPNRQADDTELLQAIIDATDIIDLYLKSHGVTATLPLDTAYRTEAFKIAVAHWVGSIIYSRNGQLDQSEQMLRYAQGLMNDYIATQNFGTTVTPSTSEPTCYPYSSKGELNQTDLTDPLNLNLTDTNDV